MKGHVRNKLPFLVGSFLLQLHPEVLNASLRKMIWESLLPQPGSSLTGENVDTLLIPLHFLWDRRVEIVVECSTRYIVQIKRW